MKKIRKVILPGLFFYCAEKKSSFFVFVILQTVQLYSKAKQQH